MGKRKIHKYTIEDCKKIAESKGGKCLSDIYVNGREKLKWQCEKGHVWETAFCYIISKRDQTWCPDCSKHPTLSIEHCQEIARSKNGKFLSTEYIHRKTKYKWQCEFGHIWETSLNNIKYGNTWCPFCSGRSGRSIEDLKEAAAKLDGYCLSEEYKGVGARYNWQCKYGHVWEAVAQNVKWGYWCPYCSQQRNENYCREIIEEWFNKKFIKIKPKWLINPETEALLELDGYCEELNIAFEYNGEQHYVPVKFKDITDEEALEKLKNQQKRDKIKQQLCKENGTELIIVKYFDRVSYKKIKRKLRKQLENQFGKER